MSITHVTVYAPTGTPETHLRLNAVDLVRHAGYTYKPGRPVSPTDAPAYAGAVAAKSTKASQEVLDRHGHRSGSEAEPAMAFAREPDVLFAADPTAARTAPIVSAEPAAISQIVTPPSAYEPAVSQPAAAPAPKPAVIDAPVVTAASAPAAEPAAEVEADEDASAPKERARRPKGTRA